MIVSDVFRIVADAEVRKTTKGSSVTHVRVAFNQRPLAGEQEGYTWWISASIFGDRGENAAPSLRKGSQVFLSGELERSTYTGNDGSQREGMNLSVSNFRFVGPKPAEAQSGTSQRSARPQGAVKQQAPVFGDDGAF